MNYPINLKSKDINALVIGAGAVALRKVDTLLKQGITSIKVIDKNIAKEDFKFKDNAFVHYTQASYEANYLEGINLVFVATDDKELNSLITKECYQENILCNVITNPSEGTFTLPAIVRRDDILISLSTSGLSPALSRALKEDIEIFLDFGYADLCTFLGRIRPLIQELELSSEKNAEIFRFFVEEPQKLLFLQYFKNKDEEVYRKIENILEYSFGARIQKVILSVL